MTDKPRVNVRVTMIDGKLVMRELMVDNLKVLEFRNKSELIDLIMQATSTLRYD